MYIFNSINMYYKICNIYTVYHACFYVRNVGAKVTFSSLRFVNATATTLSVTWSAGYPKCYSFTVSHSTQDGSINVTKPADSDTTHTLTSLQPSTTYRIEVEAVRKGDGADTQRAKVVGYFATITGLYIQLSARKPLYVALINLLYYYNVFDVSFCALYFIGNSKLCKCEQKVEQSWLK